MFKFILFLGALYLSWRITLSVVGVILVAGLLINIHDWINPNSSGAKARREAARKQEAERAAKEKEEELKRAEEARRRDELFRKSREAKLKAEQERQAHRDADAQSKPYTYEIGRHANEALAIRYGIANQEKRVKEYYYFAKGGVKTRNPERDKHFYVPASTITLQKRKRIKKDTYEVLLTNHRDRPAIAIIEKGKEYVKTFYPLSEEWFTEHKDLEDVLKGNGTFSLKELARIHVEKAVKSKA